MKWNLKKTGRGPYKNIIKKVSVGAQIICFVDIHIDKNNNNYYMSFSACGKNLKIICFVENGKVLTENSLWKFDIAPCPNCIWFFKWNNKNLQKKPT